MIRVLKIVLGIEIALGLVWTLRAAMAQGAGGLAVFGLFLFVYPLFAGFFVFAAWAFWKHAGQRRLAGWIMALPVAFWFLPEAIRFLANGPMTGNQFLTLLGIAAAAAIFAAWFFPRKVAVAIPNGLVSSRLFNWLVLLGPIAGWLLLVAVVIYVATADSSSSSSSGTAVAYAVVLAALYLVGLGVGSFGVSTWAWVSLRGGFERNTRGLHIAQLVVAAPGVVIGILVAVWLAGQGQL